MQSRVAAVLFLQNHESQSIHQLPHLRPVVWQCRIEWSILLDTWISLICGVISAPLIPTRIGRPSRTAFTTRSTYISLERSHRLDIQEDVCRALSNVWRSNCTISFSAHQRRHVPRRLSGLDAANLPRLWNQNAWTLQGYSHRQYQRQASYYHCQWVPGKQSSGSQYVFFVPSYSIGNDAASGLNLNVKKRIFAGKVPYEYKVYFWIFAVIFRFLSLSSPTLPPRRPSCSWTFSIQILSRTLRILPFLSFMGRLAPWFDIRIAPTLSNRISILDNPYVMCTPTDKKCLHFLYGLCITELTTDTAAKLKLLSCVLQYEYHSFHWWGIERMLWMEIISVPVTVKIFPSSISTTVWIKRFITTYELILLFIV